MAAEIGRHAPEDHRQQAGGATGKPRARHAVSPPASGRTRATPLRLSRSAARALEYSFGHVQNSAISRSRGISA